MPNDFNVGNAVKQLIWTGVEKNDEFEGHESGAIPHFVASISDLEADGVLLYERRNKDADG